MTITIRVIQQVYVVTISGNLDRQSSLIGQARVLAGIPAGADALLDLSAVLYLSSPGLRMLLAISRHVTEHRGRLALAGLHGESRAVMEITGLWSRFSIAETVADGLTLLRNSAGGADCSPDASRLPKQQ